MDGVSLNRTCTFSLGKKPSDYYAGPGGKQMGGKMNLTSSVWRKVYFSLLACQPVLCVCERGQGGAFGDIKQ